MIKKLSLYTFALLGALTLFNSCKKEYESIETLDTRTIEDYLSKNNIPKLMDPSGFYYQIVSEGTGAAVVNSDSVYYSYDFKHANGTSFLKNGDYTIPGTFLGYTDRFNFLTIPAVRLTLGKLKKGGTAKVILPSRMAFGKNGQPALGVESNEIVIIDLSLLNFNKQYEVDNFLINKFVTANNLQPVLDPTRVRYIISNEGTNKQDLKQTSVVNVKYTGRLLNGTVFDSSTDGVTFTLNELIKGWYQVMPGKIGVGGKIRLLIPSDLGYGKSAQTDAAGSVTIPGNSCLDFDIEIVSITN
ncbi:MULTISPECIES: FKBP-type peptidyl-prolyl cis-trans isomerase [Pedobacter]|uniref:Peptidyl-prolyl cis-trans isomerase n=1 Tax=Pedobacter heparinus (strain ATCC 13125 / DSM 2366 / CIP 104194 / JCM 7457 / NBRC 12017 / NCIMB 9290 / NRRL B-14731 / HIM 762-3) TaxID=485917 RepID=C6XUB8_PEDHD|nr:MULTISPECIES: FKBP-type peptidyl-prolyl cis-trans isomerase [Pedobacter]ACU05911.1 peptidylprolyl isomerase FKBP-type [Pedobacter heparinus DSM 2366]MBB5438690.1 FKBP-type peptidyl-prolyl cis-trans isomerase [Pedobacter sp. AK017]